MVWVSEIKNTLSGMFFFLAAWAYLRFELAEEGKRAERWDASRWGFYAIALGAFVLALLSKTVTVVLPAALLIVLWGMRGKVSSRSVLYTLPALWWSLAIASFTAHQEADGDSVGRGGRFLRSRGWSRGSLPGRIFWFYMRTADFSRYPLMAIYPRWNYSAADLLNYVPAAGCVGAGAVLFAMRQRITRWPAAGFTIFLVVALPACWALSRFYDEVHICRGS